MAHKNYGLIGSIDELTRFCDRLTPGDGPISFDIETGYLGTTERAKFSLHPETAIVVGISFTNSTDWARYIPLRHDVGENLDSQPVARLLWPLLNSGRGVAHGATFELRHLARWFTQHLADDPEHGPAVRANGGYFPLRSDTQVEAYLAADHQEFGLKYLTEAIFDHKMTELAELFPDLPKNRQKMLRFNTLELTPQVIDYACEDSAWCLALHEHYHPQVCRMGLFQVETAVLQVVCEMEEFGVVYDWGFMRRGAEELTAFQERFNAEIMTELSEMVGETVAINLASPAKVSAILYGQLGMRTSVYTAKTRDLPADQRRMSTGQIALATLAKKYPVVKRILQWKEMTRLLGTYLNSYEKQYSYAADGRTHPHHLSAVVITGRFAVADPPYQQSPKIYHFDLKEARLVHEAHAEAHGAKCRCDEYPPPPGTCFKFNFRDAIVAPPGHYILGFDLSQAELRAIAGEAQETALLRAFATGQDVHSLTAALMLKIPIDEVTSDFRDMGKTLNFALLYGMGVKSLADRMAITLDEAQSLYDSYFRVFSNIAAWRDKQIQHGKAFGYVTSRFGRKLPIWEYKSDKRWIYQKGDRACVNYPIQGAATGDMVKAMMVRARIALRRAGLQDRVHLVMNVHDALEFYVDQTVLPQQVIGVLMPAITIDVPGWPPLHADWHIAKRWGSPVKIEITDDGRYLVKGDSAVQELSPAVEVDDDTGEEDLDLGETVDAAVIRQALALVTASTEDSAARDDADGTATDHNPRRVIVELPEMPVQAAYGQFCALLAERPGPDVLTLRTPEGDLDMELEHGTDLGPADVGAVAIILGPVSVFYDADTVEPAVLVKNLVL